MARSFVPRTRSGGVHDSPWPSTVAPIITSGSAIRRIGRLESEPSPVSTTSSGRAATGPAMSRSVVPELPQ